MKPRITLITLGVDDLEASLAFYRDDLGLLPSPKQSRFGFAQAGRPIPGMTSK